MSVLCLMSVLGIAPVNAQNKQPVEYVNPLYWQYQSFVGSYISNNTAAKLHDESLPGTF